MKETPSACFGAAGWPGSAFVNICWNFRAAVFTGLMLLECGTGAWRVRSSMNTLSRELGVTTTADIGLLSIEFTCFDGDQCYTQSLCLTNTGVNTSRLNRLEHFVNDFDREGKFMTGEELHSHLDGIERIHTTAPG